MYIGAKMTRDELVKLKVMMDRNKERYSYSITFNPDRIQYVVVSGVIKSENKIIKPMVTTVTKNIFYNIRLMGDNDKYKFMDGYIDAKKAFELLDSEVNNYYSLTSDTDNSILNLNDN